MRKKATKLGLCLGKDFALGLWEIAPGAVDVKVEHRHSGLKCGALAPRTVLCRSLKRGRNALGIGRSEYAGLEVEGVAVLSDLCRPALSVHECIPVGVRF